MKDKIVTFLILVGLCSVLTLSITPFLYFISSLLGLHIWVLPSLVLGYFVFWSGIFAGISDTNRIRSREYEEI